MRFQQYIKRICDIIIATAVLIVLSPILLLVAVFIIISDGFPVFYISDRHIGSDKAIKVFKFRSMVKDAKSPKYKLVERFMQNGYLDIPINCEVYTPIGRILERTQIVEVPQMLNVLVGDMSLIGNRPLPRSNLEMLSQMNGWEKRFDSPCGITGISQIVGKFNLSATDRLRLEMLYSRVYQEGSILKCDAMITLYTIRLIIFAKGISYDKSINLLENCLSSSKLTDE